MADIFNLSDTWNDGGTVFNGIKLNVTDTASAAGSKLLDLQVGGASKFSADATGNLVSAGNINGASPTEMGYLSGVTSGIQAQLDAAGGGAFGADANTQITPSTPIVLDEATGDEAALTLDYTTNKAAGNDTGLLINQTDTLSNGISKLMDLQVGGVSKFSVGGTGTVTFPTLNTVLSSGPGVGNWYGTLALFSGGSLVTFNAAGMNLSSSHLLSWGSDTKLYRDAANTLAQRNGINAQTYNLYNTYTDASNYERGFMKWNSNVLEIGTEAGSGGGTVREWSLGIPNKKVVSGAVAGSPAVVANASYFSARQIVVSNTELSSIRDIWINSTDGVRFKSGIQVGWSSSATNSAITLDTGIARDSAGVVKVTDGSTGPGYLKHITTTVGALTAAATVGAGTKAFVTDSTSTLSSHHGQAVVGGGTDFVPVYSDGTTWRVG